MTDNKPIKHKVCRYQEYYFDGEYLDGWWCNNSECQCKSQTEECPYFPSETYNCEYYIEGDNYDYC